MIKLNKILSGKKKIAISAHIRPDGDAFGSTLALYNYMKKKHPDKETDVFLIEPNPLFSFLPGYDEIKTGSTDDEYDLFIAVDIGDPDRLGKNQVILNNAKERICIDHHLNYKNLADEAHSYVVPEASSTAELIYDLIGERDLNDDIAICIFTGIICDTGVFQYSCTSPKTMEIGAKLMTYNFDHTKVITEAFYEKTYKQNLLLGRALLESILLMDKRVIVSMITQKTLKFYDATSKDLEGIVSQMRLTKGVDVAIFMYETVTGEIKVSLRSSENIDVEEIASKFGGGGHARAAGLTLTGSFYDVVNNITAEIEKQYAENGDETGNETAESETKDTHISDADKVKFDKAEAEMAETAASDDSRE
ncbi:MAG: bifunctional oligoribonuclease/PAP phosphatase NrnA [Lachnospiraceae bacterium]|nr:bifunctional oligoribonuclease/PAP phosphatase NrnA [Lachnospiraceae bacterium]